MVATPTHIVSNTVASGTSPLPLSGTASGDLLLIFTKDGAGATHISTAITDSAGGTWTMLSASPTGSSTTGRRLELWVKFDSPTITSVSIDHTGASAAHASLIQLNGVSNSSPLGPYSTTVQAASTAPTELTAVLSEANMLVVSAFQSNSNTQAQHVSESGWTRGTTSSTGPAWAWRNDLGAVTDGCVWTTTVSQGSGTGIVAFRSEPTPTGPTIKVWNGTAEVAATVTVWNGTSEVAASLSSIV